MVTEAPAVPMPEFTRLVTVNGAEVVWPAWIVTVAGTLASVVSLLCRLTVTSLAAGPVLSDTVAVVCPPSATDELVRLTERVGPIVSRTWMVWLAPPWAMSKPWIVSLTLAVTVTVCVPSIMPSLITVTGNVTDEAPAGTMTIDGTVMAMVLLECRSMVRSSTGLTGLRVMVAMVAGFGVFLVTWVAPRFKVRLGMVLLASVSITST